MREHSKFVAAHYLQSMVHGRNDPRLALAHAQAQGHWADQVQVVSSIKMAVGGYTVADGTPGVQGGSLKDSVLQALRDAGDVALQLQNLRREPMFTRIFSNAAGVVVSQVAEGKHGPVLKGDFSAHQLTPKLHYGIVVVTDEVAKSTSPGAAAGLISDLMAALAPARNRAFLDPTVSDSVLNGASNFIGTGTAVADVDADLRALVDMVNGADHPDTAFLMTKRSATYLALLRGSGGGAAYPQITPQGGFLIGLPVFVTSALGQPGSPASSFIGLINPSEVAYADGGITLTASKNATIEMTDAPTGDSSDGTAGTTSLVSMFQADAVATRAGIEADWFARTGSAAYFVSGY